MPKNFVRVKMPRNADGLLSLAELVYAKHLADGTDSPLKSLDDYNWDDNGSMIAQAQHLNNQAKQLQKHLEELFKQRDRLLMPVNITLRASRDLLLSIYKTNYKKLEKWGFQVDDSPKPKRTTAII